MCRGFGRVHILVLLHKVMFGLLVLQLRSREVVCIPDCRVATSMLQRSTLFLKTFPRYFPYIPVTSRPEARKNKQCYNTPVTQLRPLILFVVAQLVTKYLTFIETESSLQYSQKPVAVPYTEPVKSNQPVSVIDFNTSFFYRIDLPK
jgi:hypothetical protein